MSRVLWSVSRASARAAPPELAALTPDACSLLSRSCLAQNPKRARCLAQRSTELPPSAPPAGSPPCAAIVSPSPLAQTPDKTFKLYPECKHADALSGGPRLKEKVLNTYSDIGGWLADHCSEHD